MGFILSEFLGESRAGFVWVESRSIGVTVREPSLEDLKDIVDLLIGERLALRDMMPFRKALSATRARGMLGDKDWMVPHRCLPPIVDGIGLCQTLRDKIASVLQDCFSAFLLKVCCFFPGKLKPAAKLRVC